MRTISMSARGHLFRQVMGRFPYFLALHSSTGGLNRVRSCIIFVALR